MKEQGPHSSEMKQPDVRLGGGKLSLGRLRLIFDTAIHLSAEQILFRSYYSARGKYWAISGRQPPAYRCIVPSPYVPLNLGFTYLGNRIEAPGLISTIAQGSLSCLKFSFLNQARSYEKEVDWHDERVSRLWRYYLHYFDYVVDLVYWDVVENNSRGRDLFRALVLSWIGGNRKLQGDGWHPFTISVRLVNWLEAFSFWKRKFEADDPFSELFLGSLYAQASVLSSSLEYDVRGNHLIKNLKALIYAGIVFREAMKVKWLNQALKILEKELSEQILADGGHFERAPGYHMAVLKDCLEIAVLLRRNISEGAPLWLEGFLRAMLVYLENLIPVDGRLPLLKDTVWAANPPPGDLLAAGALYFNTPEFKITNAPGIYPFMIFGREGESVFKNWTARGRVFESTALSASGYYLMEDSTDGDYMIIDAGKVCPDYLPAHAHADMFSYELSVRGKRVVVDSGVFEYAPGAWRDYFRSTRAHNTVEVCGENQSEVWGSFRVARRARVIDVEWRTEEGRALFQARHDGYRRLAVPVIHRRIVVWEKAFFWLVIDELTGEGRTKAASHIHLHPDIVPVSEDGANWCLSGLPFPLWIHSFGATESFVPRGQVSPFIQGWYSEDFGIRVPNSVVTLFKEAPLPFVFGYAITFERGFKIEWIHREMAQHEIHIETGGQVFSLTILPRLVHYPV